MDDVIFLGLLRQKHLLPGDLKGEVQAEKTVARKAELFLGKAIEPSIDVGEFEPFSKLLTAMSDEVYLNDDSLKQLAAKINQELVKDIYI